MANASNFERLSREDVAFVSCDHSNYAGMITAINIATAAEQANATAIVWYSTSSDYCEYAAPVSDLQAYPWIYSFGQSNDTRKMLDDFGSLHVGSSNASVYVTIGASSSSNQAGNTASSSSNQNQLGNPLGPSPGTAVAMIILYSITGIITALFLVIIITGAVRAHRHPERYGPRNIIGRPRQSRARGIARAMLDTIPIVKFGDRIEPKPTDVELAEGTNRDSQVDAAAPIHGAVELTEGAADAELLKEPRISTAENGIAPAAPAAGESANADTQGCSICTEDFEIGQDQRVLPCDHRFHPDCIDPWLLNVSGTCPLCRIDLRPQQPSSLDPELDEHRNPIERSETGYTLPPPLAADGNRRSSARRSLLRGLMLARPEQMTREERILALRSYRAEQARLAREAQRLGASGSAHDNPDLESGLRSRLRNAFRVRTRRTGQEDAGAPATPAVEASAPSGGGQNGQPEASQRPS